MKTGLFPRLVSKPGTVGGVVIVIVMIMIVVVVVM